MNTSHLFAEQCAMEYDIDYAGNDDTMPDGKLKCSSPTDNYCTQRFAVHDFPTCKEFCYSSDYFTWRASSKVCFCKNSDSGKTSGGGISGKINCQGSWSAWGSWESTHTNGCGLTSKYRTRGYSGRLPCRGSNDSYRIYRWGNHQNKFSCSMSYDLSVYHNFKPLM